ncbi:hypothetical protein VNI00_007778 [Paramarasmius palmivorus]|uniref:Uncharacterized protein n=1 Tax=Paramarasmius palmivorus TaxID=297713 RepID=A0AAW0CYU4_9AGAR
MSLTATGIIESHLPANTEAENEPARANATEEAAEVIDLTGLSSDSSDDEDEADEDGSDSDDNMVINERSREQLRAALNTVSVERLRVILMAICEQVPSVERAMTKEFVVAGPKNSKRKMTEEEGDGSDIEELAPRYSYCKKCKEEYDVTTERQEEECIFHTGDLECDYESFVDWDEDCHGPMDTDENRKQFPENFRWSCCDEDGTDKGCEREMHEPTMPYKRRRVNH